MNMNNFYTLLEEMKYLAVMMRYELEQVDVDAFARLLNEHWEVSKKLDTGSTNTCIDQIFASCEDLIDGKFISGAGGGGFLQVILKKGVSKDMLRAVIERINETKPDFVWVGLGAPKQEKWMAAHQGEIDGLMLGVGAGFDYYAGNIKRAPIWMQEHNLEWLYRLVQDPKRLFKRYWSTNTKFIWNAVIRGK